MSSISDCQYLKGIVSKRSSRTTRTHFNNLVFLTFDPIYRWDSYDRGRLCQEGKTRTCNDATIFQDKLPFTHYALPPNPCLSKCQPVIVGLFPINRRDYKITQLSRFGFCEPEVGVRPTFSHYRLFKLAIPAICKAPTILARRLKFFL